MKPRFNKDSLIRVLLLSAISVSQEVFGTTLENQNRGQHEMRAEVRIHGQQISSIPDRVLHDEDNYTNHSPIPHLVPTIPSNDSNIAMSGIRSKRQGIGLEGQVDPRTFGVDVGVGPGIPPPLCFEREVKGTCRYRSSPEECFRHDWTAYATIANLGYKKITSLPEGLLVHPGGHARVRVFLKTSCCTPVVHFIATDIFLQDTGCAVDVRELQDLHPGEIVGIAVGSLLFVILVIIGIALCVRYQRQKKLKKDTVIFGRSLTRSKSGNGSLNHR